MRQQMKTLEQKNEIYMQQTISLEEDSKRANALKNQVIILLAFHFGFEENFFNRKWSINQFWTKSEPKKNCRGVNLHLPSFLMANREQGRGFWFQGCFSLLSRGYSGREPYIWCAVLLRWNKYKYRPTHIRFHVVNILSLNLVINSLLWELCLLQFLTLISSFC